MNKILTFIGALIVTFIFAYTIPVTVRNPIFSNLIVSIVLVVVDIILIWILARKRKSTQGQLQPIQQGG